MLQLGDDQVELLRVRDPRARRIKLSVDERGPRLTLPTRASLLDGERFVQQNLGWLQAQLARYRDVTAMPRLQRGEPGQLPLRGRDWPLQWGPGRYAKVELEAEAIRIDLPERAGPRVLPQALRQFYEAQARADIGRWLPKYLPSLTRAPRQIRFKVMSSQWGSLAPDGSMALDLSLVLGRPSAFEYVLVHELCHLLQANHSPAFWAEVEARCPQWRSERDYFHQHGRNLKARMRALLTISS